MPAAWTACGAPTSGSIVPHLDGTKAGSGCAATMNTTRFHRTLARVVPLRTHAPECSPTPSESGGLRDWSGINQAYLASGSGIRDLLASLRDVSIKAMPRTTHAANQITANR